tara:strand:+ start:1858 stop:2505 length:648 start_codon:yes stop_codon:yes gene_type:complete
MKDKKLFIFDLDGTLVNAYKAIENSLNFTRKQLGYGKVNSGRIRFSVGHGDKDFVSRFFNKQDKYQALAIYRKHHKKALLRNSSLYPKTKLLLYTLRKKGKKVAVASNRPSFYTNILLKTLGIRKYFDAVYCADKVGSLKPDPKILKVILDRFKNKTEEAIYFGDMDIDLETAKRAKIDMVFKKGGSSRLSEVKKYKTKKVISKLEDILKELNKK